MRGNGRIVSKQESVIDPAPEKSLLKLHRAVDVKSFWKAVHRLLSASVGNHSVGLLLQQNPRVPVIAKWTRSKPGDSFAAQALTHCANQPRCKKLVRLKDLFRNRNSFIRSGLYRRCMAPHKCAYGVMLSFLETQESHLRHRNFAHGEAGGLFDSRNEIASATLPTASDRASPDRIPRTRTICAGRS